MGKVAVILGASGLVGSRLLNLLLEDDAYTKVVALSRNPLDCEHPKLEQSVGDLLSEKAFDHIYGDELFCCIGTTQSKTPDISEYRKIDYGIPTDAARAAIQAGIKRFFVISSMGARSDSRTFYLRVKGQMEETLQKMAIPRLYIFRPSLLLGQRREFRFGERVAAVLMGVFAFAIPMRYRGIRAEDVARAIHVVAQSNEASRVFESDEMIRLAASAQA